MVIIMNDAIIDPLTSISDYLSQIYVIHQTGMVMLSRNYSTSTINSDPQLIGGFLAAILTFAKVTSNDNFANDTGGIEDISQIKDIGMTHSRWFIESIDEYTVAILVPNSSPLIQNERYEFIYNLCKQIITTFTIFKTFNIDIDNSIETAQDYSEDFGYTTDNIVHEQLSGMAGITLKHEDGGKTQIFDLPVNV